MRGPVRMHCQCQVVHAVGAMIYLRFMLQDVGVRFLKRWIMWSAVAMRSRWVASAWKRALVIMWLLAAAAGMTTFVLAAADGDIGRMAAAAAAPAIFAFLWGKQYGADSSPPSPRHGSCRRPCCRSPATSSTAARSLLSARRRAHPSVLRVLE